MQPWANHDELWTPRIELMVVATGHEAPTPIRNWVRAVIGLCLPIKAEILGIADEAVALFAVREQPEI
jgi:hypothetical protein